MSLPMGQAAIRIVGDMSDFQADLARGVRAASQKLSTVGADLTRTGRSLTTQVTLPLLGVGKAMVKSVADFEWTMTQITALVGIPREQVAAWEEDVRGLAITYGKSAKESAEALYFITSSGIDAADAMGVLDIALKASTAGLGEAQILADALTSAVNAYGIENLSAAQAADILTAAVKYGKLEATELAPVLGRLLPTSSALGISFDQVAGTLAVMSRTGLGAAEASTSLNAVLSTLLKPTAQSTKLLEASGLSMAQLRSVAAGPGGLVEVMRILDSTFQDNDEALAQIIPNIRAFRGVMNVLAQDASSVDEVMAGVAGSAGSLDAAFEEVSQTAKFQMAQAMATVKDLLLEVGQTVMPMVVQILEKIAAGARRASEWWKGLSEESRNLIVKIAGLAAAAGPVLLTFGKMSTLGGALLDSFGKLGDGIGRLGGMFSGLGRLGAPVMGMFSGFGRLGGALVDRFSFLGGGIGRLGGMFSGLGRLGAPVLGLFGKLGNALSPLGTAFSWVGQAAQPFLGAMGKIGGAIGPLLGGLLKLGAGFGLIPLAIGGAIAAFAAMTGQEFGEVMDKIMGAITGFAESLPEKIPAIVDAALGIVDKIAENLPVFIDAGLDILLALVDGIVSNIDQIVAGILKVVDGLIKAITRILPKLVDAGVKLILALVDGLLKSLPAIIKAITDTIVYVIEAIVQMLPELIDAAITLFLGLVDGLLAALPDIIQAVVDAIPRIISALVNALPAIVKGAITLFLGIGRGLIEALPQIVGLIFTDLIPGLVGAFAESAGAILQAGRDIMLRLWDGLKGVWKDVWDWLTARGKDIALAVQPWKWGDPRTVGATEENLKNLEAELERQASGKSVQETFGYPRAVNAQLAAGLAQGRSSVTAEASKTAAAVAGYFPRSPAKTGPLSGKGSPEVMGRTIALMLAAGLAGGRSSVESASGLLARSISAPKVSLPNVSLGASPTPRLSGGEVTMNVEMNFTSEVTPEMARAAGDAAARAALDRLARERVLA